MTLLEKALSKEGLARIDTFRQRRGIRTRRQALETLLKETIPMKNEHPLTTKLRLARVSHDAVPEEVQAGILEWREGRAETTSHAEMRQILQRRKSEHST
jgi:hypothetical protein